MAATETMASPTRITSPPATDELCVLISGIPGPPLDIQLIPLSDGAGASFGLETATCIGPKAHEVLNAMPFPI